MFIPNFFIYILVAKACSCAESDEYCVSVASSAECLPRTITVSQGGNNAQIAKKSSGK